MRIIVCMKQGLDPQSVKISRSREELDLREARMRTQPEDKIALEAALRLKDLEGADGPPTGPQRQIYAEYAKGN